MQQCFKNSKLFLKFSPSYFKNSSFFGKNSSGESMKDKKLVWSDDLGDLRKSKNSTPSDDTIDESSICLEIRRLTSGKGRTVIEIKGLPNNKAWNKKLAKNLKKKLGVGGAYKDNYIEIHGEKIEPVKSYLESINIKFKQTGG